MWKGFSWGSVWACGVAVVDACLSACVWRLAWAVGLGLLANAFLCCLCARCIACLCYGVQVVVALAAILWPRLRLPPAFCGFALVAGWVPLLPACSVAFSLSLGRWAAPCLAAAATPCTSRPTISVLAHLAKVRCKARALGRSWMLGGACRS